MATSLRKLRMLQKCITTSRVSIRRPCSSNPGSKLPSVEGETILHNPRPPGRCKIRQLHPREVSVLSNSQPVEGSRLRNEELRLMYDTDPNGFFLATADDGDVVGTVAALRLSDKLGFIGFHHVRDSFLEEGARLWDVAVGYLGDRNIGIEVAMQDVEKYMELGFKEEWRNGCFKGSGIPLLPEVQSNRLLRSVAEMGFGRVVDFDTDVCGEPRVKFLLKWLRTDNPRAAQAVLEDNRVVGYGVIRPLQRASSHRIGPLLAENTALAQVLLLSLLSSVPQQTLYLDSPLDNPSFTRLLETDLKMEQVQERARMYTRGNPHVNVRKVFGMLSKDIG
ncbi:uncharacterized protein LOC110991044 [Acanthaster planci]|uniref:Uncharacterized protein LOC110991044 n=1 Tax=Acanthaster planci TaxID=133434 RepID=A0A8B8A280_ACAPL|nr:uncharacterized protein LOC110991044 [Acanthaster planci]XP_022111833.1 uncharacterized protein LOC110991044 [Acanthaster planci]XP_022111834.1 uncharacterized protein LOC110991044 [Acanthaster planci]XP_022111835.1 uncharacterized protein LOC110991044 [Acanthaster planci]